MAQFPQTEAEIIVAARRLKIPEARQIESIPQNCE